MVSRKLNSVKERTQNMVAVGVGQTETGAYLAVPKFLISGQFGNMDPAGAIVYAYLLERTNISKRNRRFRDRDGRVFVRFSQRELSRRTGLSESTIKAKLKLLEAYGLIERRERCGYTSDIFVFYPENVADEAENDCDEFGCYDDEIEMYSSEDSYMDADEVTDMEGVVNTGEVYSEPAAKEADPCVADDEVVDRNHLREGQNPPTKKKYHKETKKRKTSTITVDVSGVDVSADVFPDEYQALHKEISTNLQSDAVLKQRRTSADTVNRIIDLIVKTLKAKIGIHVHKMWHDAKEVSSVFRSLDASHLEYVLDYIESDCRAVPTDPYLRSVLFNAPVYLDSYYKRRFNEYVACGML